MIYLDSSVALAQLFAEDRQPPASLRNADLISSRLLTYEVWIRTHEKRFPRAHHDDVRDLLDRIEQIDLTGEVLARALHPFPLPVRTLDAIHLATVDFIKSQGRQVELASYDNRMVAVARALGFDICEV